MWGVHLTLTSEWDTCRWGPVSTVSPASGLIDGDGYFWRDLESVRRHLVVEAAETEMRAQIERAVSAGMAPTHLDAHMGVAMMPELLPAMIRLGREFGMVPVLPRTIGWVVDVELYRGVVEELRGAGGFPRHGAGPCGVAGAGVCVVRLGRRGGTAGAGRRGDDGAAGDAGGVVRVVRQARCAGTGVTETFGGEGHKAK